MNVQRRIQSFGVEPTSTADALALALRQMGVRRIFGVPGGRTGLELIAAARAQGIRFIVTRHETAGVIAAGVTGELSGTPGVALVSQGPGIANALTGVASMALDRSPMILICDGFDAVSHGFARNQAFDHISMLAPVVKAHGTMLGDAPAAVLGALSAAAMASPRGPVLLDLDREVPTSSPSAHAEIVAAEGKDMHLLPADAASVAAMQERLAISRRPVIVLGMETRYEAVAQAARDLAERLECPVFVTYKAKGVLPDEHPLHAGIFTGGIAEAPVISKADLILLVGVDPVELTPGSWRTDVPVAEIALVSRASALAPELVATGELAATMAALAASARTSDWDGGVIGRHRGMIRAALAYPGRRDAVGPQRVVEMALAATRLRGMAARVTIDAGAHMISATTFWSCEHPNDLLISHGLAATGYAIPAAIAASLQEPSRPVIAFVGDGGLAISMAELATAVSAGVRIVVIVFNDDGPSVVAANRGGRQGPQEGLDWQHIDFAQVMRGLGGRGTAVRTVDEYSAALDEALTGEGPALIDVRVDPAGYHRQLRAVRG